MENIAHRAGVELISLTFWATVLAIRSATFTDITMIPTLNKLICLCSVLHEWMVQTTTPDPPEL